MPPTDDPDRSAGPDVTAGLETPDAELSRLRSDAVRHQRLRDLTAAFSLGVSSPLGLRTALKTLARDANTLLGARRTAIWLHERRHRELTLASSSDEGRAAAAGRVASDDPDAPPARGLRLDRPTVGTSESGVLLLAPLRGWRRALGAMVVEGPFTGDLEGAQLAEFAHELSRQLSAAIENIQLLEEILRQRRLLEDTFNSLVDLVVVTDPSLRVMQMNDAFRSRVGRARAELLERPLHGLIGEETAAWIVSRHTAGHTPSDPHGASTARFDDARLGGTFAVTMTPLVTRSGDPAGHVVVARDITEHVQLEREREALGERLAQSEKLAALGQFVAGIAHEMNNPLQGVLGHLELMIRTSQAPKPLRRDLRRIYQEADRAAKIVRNLTMFTGSRRLARRRLRLPLIVSRALASRTAALQRAGIDVTRDESPELPWVFGDPLLLHQAFLNILINAEDAVLSTGHGGRLEVRTHLHTQPDRVVTTVRDTGPGIAPEVLPRLFDPFFTTKEVGKGTGLGLAITYGIVQEHGGTIHAANAPGGGAIFTIELPAAGNRTRVRRRRTA